MQTQVIVQRRSVCSVLQKVLVGILFVMCSGCTDKALEEAAKNLVGESVVVSGSDSTPPSVLLRFTDPTTGKLVEIKSGDPNKTVPIKAKDTVVVFAIAEDPQGAQEIRLCPSAETRCSSGQIGQVQHPTYPCAVSASQATPGNTATTKLFVVDAVNPPSCDQGFQFVSSYRALWVQAKNFSGMTTSAPSLVFQVTP